MGIDRNIAYTKRKYHSGCMWGGVIKGLAGIKFSGSDNIVGVIRIKILKKNKKIINPVTSLDVKNGWNGKLSNFEGIPKGFFEPCSCKNTKCIILVRVKIKGATKWNTKNRCKVGLSTEYPPQIHCTISIPTYGIAVTKFVITVAAQNDICPHGRT